MEGRVTNNQDPLDAAQEGMNQMVAAATRSVCVCICVRAGEGECLDLCACHSEKALYMASHDPPGHSSLPNQLASSLNLLQAGVSKLFLDTMGGGSLFLYGKYVCPKRCAITW